MTILIIVCAVVIIAGTALGIWAEKKISLLTEELKIMGELYDKYIDDLKADTKKYTVTYKFTESDLLKSELQMIKEAKTRALCALGRKIGRDIAPEELIQDGLLIGYRYKVEVRRAGDGE